MDKIVVRDLHVLYGDHEVLKGVSFTVHEHEILSIIGPAHSGKTTLLRTLNRLTDREREFRRVGEVMIDGKEIRSWDLALLRRTVGMIFATPVPIPEPSTTTSPMARACKASRAGRS